MLQGKHNGQGSGDSITMRDWLPRDRLRYQFVIPTNKRRICLISRVRSVVGEEG